MNIKNKVKNILDHSDKIILITTFSIIITLLFAFYNGYLGLTHKDSWGISIFIYYLCLVIAKSIAVKYDFKLKNKTDNKQIVIKKTYIKLSIFMFFIDLCLLAPITIMVTNPKEVAFGLIPSIIMATYTTYKIIISIINYKKINKNVNLIYKFLRELSVIDSLVSVLTLQHTLIMVNGGMTSDMKTLSAITSFIIVSIVIIFSIVEMIKTIKMNIV